MSVFISEVEYSRGNTHDFIEVAVKDSIDVSSYTVLVYGSDGFVDESLSLGSLVNTVAGKDVYLIDNSTSGFNGIGGSDAIAVIDDLGNIVQFISFGGSVTANDGAASGSTSTNIGTTTGNRSLQSDDVGASYYVQNSPNAGTVPCYAPGTLIATPSGPRAVETLAPGDLVETLDHGAVPIQWCSQKDQALEKAEAGDKPILIAAGAFGPYCPESDLVVSPQHRILVGTGGQFDDIFEGPCLAPAKALTGLPGIREMNGKKKITWVHFALATHEIVFAEGCLSESLLLGRMVLDGLTTLQRKALTEIFGNARAPDGSLNGPAARDCQHVGQVRRALGEARRSNADSAMAA